MSLMYVTMNKKDYNTNTINLWQNESKGTYCIEWPSGPQYPRLEKLQGHTTTVGPNMCEPQTF